MSGADPTIVAVVTRRALENRERLVLTTVCSTEDFMRRFPGYAEEALEVAGLFFRGAVSVNVVHVVLEDMVVEAGGG